MWWKTVAAWLRDKVDVDLDLDLDGRAVAVTVVVRIGDAAVFSERFEWPFPAAGKPARLAGKLAQRSRVVAGA